MNWLIWGLDCARWICTSFWFDSSLELDCSYWNNTGLWPNAFWKQAVPVETVLLTIFSLYPREKFLRNGISVIKMLRGYSAPPKTPAVLCLKTAYAFIIKEIELTKSNSELQCPLWGTSDLPKLGLPKSKLESTATKKQKNLNGMPVLDGTSRLLNPFRILSLPLCKILFLN